MKEQHAPFIHVQMSDHIPRIAEQSKLHIKIKQ